MGGGVQNVIQKVFAVKSWPSRKFMLFLSLLPVSLRSQMGSLATFKRSLDDFCVDVPDTPLSDTRVAFTTDNQGAPTNSLRHVQRALASDSYGRLLHSTISGGSV